MLTVPVLARLLPAGDGTVRAWLSPLAVAAERYGIAEPSEWAMWLANIGHESRDLTRLEEDLRYSAERLVAVWPGRFFFPQDGSDQPVMLAGRHNALLYEGRPREIAERVYGGRMGNLAPGAGDGYLFRGRGPAQLTGRANYAAFAEATGVPSVEHPDVLLEPEEGALSAGWFWRERDLAAPARAGDVREVRRRWNGGTHGLSDVAMRYQRAMAVLS